MSLSLSSTPEPVGYDPAGGKRPDGSILVRHRYSLILAGILLAAGFFRFFGTNFDQSHNQHPDERFIVGRTIALQWPADPQVLLDVRNSPMNLRSAGLEPGCPPTGCGYPYGSLPVYLTRATGWVLDSILPPTSTRPKGYFLQGYEGTTLLGRSLASLFDLITVVLVFLIGRRLYSRSTGLIAAALSAFAVTQIQLAHFYASDTFLTTFMMGAIYFAVVLMQRPAWWAAAGLGACVGLAVASKVTIIPFALIVVAAVALRTAYRTRTRKLGAEFGDPVGVKPASPKERARPTIVHFLGGLPYVFIAALCALLAFAVTEPYVLWSFDLSLLQRGGLEAVKNSNPWWTRLMQESDTQSGRGDAPYTRQYVGTVPLFYHLQQLIFWGLSPIPGLVVLAGFVAGIWRAIRGRPAEVLLLTGAIPYFATILTLEAKWMRYMLPLVPIFCLLGAALLVRGVIWERARQARTARKPDATSSLVPVGSNAFALLTVITVGAAFLWAVAFANIYTQDHSRQQASQWIYDNIPPGSRLSGEVWDDFLPLGGPEGYGKLPRPEGGYFGPSVSFDLYPDRPPQETLNYIRDQMAQADYIAIASNRLYGSMARLPWRYGVQNRFYELLFAEKLGFVRLYTAQVTPELFGIKFNDQMADESFTVYDHPRADIFKKVSTLTDDQLTTLFSTALNRPPGEYNTGRHGQVSDSKSLAIDQPLSSLPDVGDYSWNPLAQEDTQWIGVLLWLLAVQVIGFLALPILFTVTRNLPDGAYPASKLLGLLIVSWATWLLSNARILPFTVWSVGLMIIVLGGLGLLCWRFGAGIRIRAFFTQKRNLVIFYELVFLATFLAFLGIRLLNPDLWHPVLGGEKPMELGFLNATLRSPWMPPADPFFAGGYINYYYYGYFVVACLIKLVGMNPSIAFNVAVPTLYAMAFSGAVSVGYNIVAASRRERGKLNYVSRVGMALGVLSGVLMLGIGNLHGLYQLVRIGSPQTAEAFLRWLSGVGISMPSLANYTSFNYWDPRSIIPYTINEFPFWTFLFADLHPHLIDLPITILALLLSINVAFTTWKRVNNPNPDVRNYSGWRQFGSEALRGLADLWGPGGRGAAGFSILAIVLGALAVTNSWDFPTYLLLTGVAIMIALLRLRRGDAVDDADRREQIGGQAVDFRLRSESGRARLWPVYLASLASLGALTLFSLLAYLPFFLSFKAFYTDIVPIVDGGMIPGSGDIMRRTSLSDFLLFWAFFIFIALSYLIYRLWRFPWRQSLADLMQPFGPATNQTNVSKRTQPSFGTRPLFLTRRASALAAASPVSSYSTTIHAGDSTFETGGMQPMVGFTTAASNSDPGAASDPLNAHTVEQPEVSGKQNEGEEITGDSTQQAVRWQRLLNTARPGNLTWGDLTNLPEYEHDPNATMGAVYARPDVPNWVAAAHSHAVAPPVVTRTRNYPGVLPLPIGLAILALTAGLVVLQLATGQYLLALLIALLGGIAGTTLADTRSAPGLMAGALLCVALAVAMGVELVFLADHLRYGSSFRMNTVFKFYVQVWVLFAAGGAPAVYYLLFGLRDRLKVKSPSGTLVPSAIDQRVPAFAASQNGSSEHESPTLGNGESTLYPSSAMPAVPEAIAEPPRNWLVWSSDTPAMEQPVPGEISQTPLTAQGLMPVATGSQEAGAAPELIQRKSWRPNFTPVRLAWLGLFMLFLASTLLYTFYGTQARVNDRFPVRPPIDSLDGMNYMTTGSFTTEAAPLPINLKQDYAAINWMKTNITGLHTIAEVPLGYYRDFGMRAAANTGFPMVVGGLHQEEQRSGIYDRLVQDRRNDMNEFFTTADIQRTLILISKYDIEYIYAGQLEAGRAGNGLAKFEQMADPKVGVLKAVFKTDPALGTPGTIIYQVVKAANTIVGAPAPNSGNQGISITPLPTATSTAVPTPPVNDPELNRLIAAVVANPTDRDARMALIAWYQGNGFPGDAARELETIVTQDPQNVAARQMLGDAYQSAGQPDKALRAWEDARNVDPNNPAGHNKLGIALIERQRFDDAIAEFQAAVKVDDRFVEAYFHLGTAYEGKGDVNKAKEAYQSAIDKSSERNSWSDQAQQRLSKLK